MMITILSDLTSYIQAVEGQKEQWLYDLLHFLEIDIDKLNSLPPDMGVEYLMKNGVYITDYPSIGALKVEYRKDRSSPLVIVGEWAGATYVIKKDDKEKMYYEISIECWSIIDDAIDMD